MSVYATETSQLRQRIEELETLAIDLRDTLVAVNDRIDGYVDVVDGDEDGPRPNNAMLASEEIDNALARAEKVL